MKGRRIVIHGGFHKTGTTSAQKFVLDNGALIWPHAATVLPGRSRARVARHAVRYSITGDRAAMARFRRTLAELLGGLNLGKRALLISDENLCGRMPGRDAQDGYDSAPDLMAAMVQVIRRDIDPDPDLHFVFTTRNPESWLRSTWRHNLAQARLTLDYDAYAVIHRQAADLDGTVAAVRAAVAPYPVHAVPVETLAETLEGPATPLLHHLGLPSDAWRKLVPAARANPGPEPALAHHFLDLNRSDLSDDDLKAQKAALRDSPSATT